MSQALPKATFITFYSFKGGVGRSMALINTAAMLAGRGLGVVRQGFRVLVLDLDLEAPGLSYLVNAEADSSQPGFVDLMIDAKERGGEADLFALPIEEVVRRYTRPYRFPNDPEGPTEGTLDIMPAGCFDGDYTRRFDTLNLRQLYQEGLGEPLIRVFKTKIANAGLYDYVLVDSRTGFSDEAGICTRDLADCLIIVSGLNRQNVEGTCDFLRAFRAATEGQTEGRKPIRIVLSPVPNGEDDLLDQREREAKVAFEAAWGADVDLSLQIPYHPKLALTEEPHISRRRRGALFEAYRNITSHILSAIGHDTASLTQTIKDTLRRKDYQVAHLLLKILVRLEEGPSAVWDIAGELPGWNVPNQKDDADDETRGHLVTLETILKDSDGRRVLEFIIDHLPNDRVGLSITKFLERLDRMLPIAVDAFFNRLKENMPSKTTILGHHAVALDVRLKNPARADLYYSKAVALGQEDVSVLTSYARFLELRGNNDEAKAYYKRAVSADPNNATILADYARYLLRQGELDSAREYYERSVVIAPDDGHILGYYALFLERRGELESADRYYERSVAVKWGNANNMGNYGQFLVGQARYREGYRFLLNSHYLLGKSSIMGKTEVCFSLWVVARILKYPNKKWERGFKFGLQQGFQRGPWSFDGILRRAEPILSTDEFAYAKAMAAAFLDKARVADLESFQRWRDLEPLDPAAEVVPPTDSDTASGL